MIVVFLFYTSLIFAVAALGAFVSDTLADKLHPEEDDLAWVDEQIRRVEDGDPRSDDNQKMQAQRHAYLERLRRVRERLTGNA